MITRNELNELNDAYRQLERLQHKSKCIKMLANIECYTDEDLGVGVVEQIKSIMLSGITAKCKEMKSKIRDYVKDD